MITYIANGTFFKEVLSWIFLSCYLKTKCKTVHESIYMKSQI